MTDHELLELAAKDEVIAEAGEMLAMRDRQLAALKAELREICAAIDDPACDLTLTAVECIKKLKAENEWQPIETAPKDGTVFLGYKLGQFRECYKVPRDDCDMWCFGGTSGADDLFPNIKPTHWMPLPKPPAMAKMRKEMK